MAGEYFREKEEELGSEAIPETSEFAKGSAALRSLDEFGTKHFKTYGKAKKLYHQYVKEPPSWEQIGEWFLYKALNRISPKNAPKFGPRILGKYYDPAAYSIVNETVEKAIKGNFLLKYKSLKSHEVKQKAEEILGRKFENAPFGVQDGVTAYIAEDVKNVLNNDYNGALKKSGLPEEKFVKAAPKYIYFHEEAEAAFQKKIAEKESEVRELTESEHGMVQAYVLQSLKRSGNKDQGTEDIYRVAVAIDSLRGGAFGQYIRKYFNGFEEVLKKGWKYATEPDLSFGLQPLNVKS